LNGNKRKKSLAALFSFIPIEQPFEQWSRAAQAKFVPTRVAVSAGNKSSQLFCLQNDRGNH
jgi:hypothetical protein